MNLKMIFASLCCLAFLSSGAFGEASTVASAPRKPAVSKTPDFTLTAEQANDSILVMKFIGGFVASPNCSVEILRSGAVISRCPRRKPYPVLKIAELSPYVVTSIEKTIDEIPAISDAEWSTIQAGQMIPDMPVEQIISIGSTKKQTLLYQIFGTQVDGLKESFKNSNSDVIYSFEPAKSLKALVSGFARFMECAANCSQYSKISVSPAGPVHLIKNEVGEGENGGATFVGRPRDRLFDHGSRPVRQVGWRRKP